MRKFFLSAIGAMVLVGMTAAADSSSVAPSGLIISREEQSAFHKDRVLVQMRAATSPLKTAYTFQKSAEVSGLTFERTIAIEPDSTSGGAGAAYALMKLDSASDSVEKAIARLKNHPDVEFAQPDFIYRTFAVPNDPDYGSLWGLKNTGQTIAKTHASQNHHTTANPGTAGRDMGLETAWNTVTDCSNVVVAVIDTGIDLDHDDLKDNLWTNGAMEHGYDFANSDNDPSDDGGHGTHVAGTIGARGNNGILTTGVCWRVQLMALKVFSASSGASTSNVVAAVNYARTNGAHIINMSLGGNGFDQMFFNSVKAASDAGVLSVVAAGNDNFNNGSSPIYPCNFDVANVICVGAVNQSFARASFSNYSTTHVDIGAPGTNIVSSMFYEYGPPINIPLTMGTWTLSNANFAFFGGFLQNPAAWDGVAINYANNQDDSAYTSVDLTGTTDANLIVDIRGASEGSVDYFSIYERGAGGDPVASGTKLVQVSGSTGGSLVSLPVELSTCVGSATCAVGFKFTSSAAITRIGFRVEAMNVEPMLSSTAGFDTYNGTSMASPHVAGLAALIKASNPAFTAADLKNAILTTGTTVSGLSGSFKFSSVANAPAALKYVDAPLGVSAAVVP